MAKTFQFDGLFTWRRQISVIKLDDMGMLWLCAAISQIVIIFGSAINGLLGPQTKRANHECVSSQQQQPM
jgi:hypothetical protein